MGVLGGLRLPNTPIYPITMAISNEPDKYLYQFFPAPQAKGFESNSHGRRHIHL
jgi:hypothetical protein